MEIINIIILVALIANIVITVFIWLMISKSNDKVEDLSLLINKLVMNIEESRRKTDEKIEEQIKVISKEILDSTQENKLQLNYQKSFMEKSSENIKKDLSEIKECLDYLSTEVNID
ncbi:hypothetical protein GW796_08850 [archaeon]|nr:hypothetical protein [archaeon]NCQ51986.1 hypothetical protein [archaeon]